MGSVENYWLYLTKHSTALSSTKNQLKITELQIRDRGETLKTSSRQIMRTITLVGALIAIVLLSIQTIENYPIFRSGPSTIEKQETLRAVIRGYIADGILLKVEKDSSTPNVYITPLFESLTASEKRVILAVILDYFKNDDQTITSIDLFASQTERPIGNFDGNKLTIY